jgi:hypothetical protein
MFVKIALVLILFSADGAAYKDVIGLFDDHAECETAKKAFLADWPDTSAFYFATCVQPKPVKSQDS